MIFFVPQLGTLRRVLGYHTFLPRSMSSFLGFTLLGIAIVGAFTMWIKGAVAGIEGMVGLLFMGLLFVQISRKK